MENKNLIIGIFMIMCAIQLFAPIKMIIDKEKVLNSGIPYKFRTAPIDPSDPFRGKYIILSFDENKFNVNGDAYWASGENIYVLITNDSLGFAKIAAVSKERPIQGIDYIKATVSYASTYDSIQELTIAYPFDRFYMEESKAYDAERVYWESSIRRDTTSRVAYALVSIKDGESAIKNVFIDDVPIKEIVEKRLQEKESQP